MAVFHDMSSPAGLPLSDGAGSSNSGMDCGGVQDQREKPPGNTHCCPPLPYLPFLIPTSLYYPLLSTFPHPHPSLPPPPSQDVLAILLQNPKALSSAHITVPCPLIPSDHNAPSNTDMECDRGAITFNERIEQGQWGEVWKGAFCRRKQVTIRIFTSGK